MSANIVNTKNVPPDLAKQVARRVIQVLVVAAVSALILFVAAWDLGWGWGWVNVAVYVGILTFNLWVFSRIPHGRELVAERGQEKEDAKPWDRILGPLVGLYGPVSLLVVAGLDHRFGWTAPLSWGLHWIGLVLTIVGYLTVTWSMASNAYFSGLVRIQTDRGHHVAKNGPYHFVRHPGYVGMITYNLMTPLLLGSLWALIPAGITMILFIIRTAFEDRMLLAELSGYREYAKQTRYRLLPYIFC